MKSIKFLVEKPIAHRGLHNRECPENSLCAFEDAVKKGFPVELDVQMTVDGELIVFHDWRVSRMTDKQGVVGKLTLEGLNKLFLQNTKEKIPTLESVLELVGGRVPIVIEIKKKGFFVNDVCSVVRKKLKSYEGEIAISSFNPFVVRWYKIYMPDIVRGQNFIDFKDESTYIAFFKKIFLYCMWMVSNNDADFFTIHAGMLPKSFPVWIALRRQKVILTYAIKNKKKYSKIKNIIDNKFFLL